MRPNESTSNTNVHIPYLVLEDDVQVRIIKYLC